VMTQIVVSNESEYATEKQRFEPKDRPGSPKSLLHLASAFLPKAGALFLPASL